MKVGVVTITYNSSKVVVDFLKSLSKQTYSDFKLYIIDNNSQDDTIDLIKKHCLNSQVLIRNKENIGVAAGNNLGIKQSLDDNCQFVLLINNDTVFEKNLLEKLINSYKTYNSSIITPKMMYYDAKDTIWYAGGFLNKKKGYLNYHRGQDLKDLGQFSNNDIVTYSPTCCTLIHKSVFLDIGLMDEKYFVYFDDTDFFYRVYKHGKHEVRYINNIKFYHKIGSLTKSRKDLEKSKYGDFFIKQMICNQIYFLKKQKKIWAFMYIFYMIIKIHIMFFIGKKYTRDFRTFIIIYKSIFRGFFL